MVYNRLLALQNGYPSISLKKRCERIGKTLKHHYDRYMEMECQKAVERGERQRIPDENLELVFKICAVVGVTLHEKIK